MQGATRALQAALQDQYATDLVFQGERLLASPNRPLAFRLSLRHLELVSA